VIGTPADFAAFVVLVAAVFSIYGTSSFLERVLSKLNGLLAKNESFALNPLPWHDRKIFLIHVLLIATLFLRLESFANSSANLAFCINVCGLLLCILTFVPRTCLIAFSLLATSLNTIIDPLMGSGSLGSMVCSLMLWFFVLHYSGVFDANRKSNENAARSYLPQFLLLMGYCLLTFSSGINHLKDEYWRSGTTCGLILLAMASNPKGYFFATEIYKHYTHLYLLLSQLMTWSMIAWFLVLPLLILFNRYTRWAAIILGLAFFSVDAFLLPLTGNLGIYHFSLWAILFLPVHWLKSILENPKLNLALSRVDCLVASFALKSSYKSNLAQKAILLICLLALAFLLRISPVQAIIPKWGQLHPELGLGICPVNVFNSTDIKTLPLLLKVRTLNSSNGASSPPEKVETFFHERRWSDSLRTKVLGCVRLGTYSRLWAYDQENFGAIIKNFAAELARLEPGIEYAEIEWVKCTLPQQAEFLNGQFVLPNQFKRICTVTINMQSSAVETVQFDQSGIEYFCKELPYKIDAKIAAERLPFFPAQQETKLFFNSLANFPDHLKLCFSSKKAEASISELVYFGPDGPPCYAAFEKLLLAYDSFGLDICNDAISRAVKTPQLANEVVAAYRNIPGACKVLPENATVSECRKWYFSGLLKPKSPHI
jgi:hypothetical protein